MWKSHASPSSKLKKDDGSTVVIAINDDKTSQSALKWASDHLLAKGQSFYLLHVRKKVTTISTPTGQQLPIDSVNEESLALFLQQRERQTKALFIPFEIFCSKRGLLSQTVVLEDTEVPKAIIDFVVDQSVDKLVLGASSRNAFTRTFKQPDVPTSVSKLAPEFCSIYVINKGKISSIRPAPCPNKRPPPNQVASQKYETTGNTQYQSAKSEPTPRLPEPIELTREQRRMGPRSRGSGAVPTSAYNGIVGDGRLNLRINYQEGQETYNHDLLYKSVSSCPSPTRSSFECRPFNISSNINNVKDHQRGGGDIGVPGGLRSMMPPNGQMGEQQQQQIRYEDQYDQERSAINDQWNRVAHVQAMGSNNSWSSSTTNSGSSTVNESYARSAPALPIMGYGSTGHSPDPVLSQQSFGGYSPPVSQQSFGGHSPPISQHSFGSYSPPLSQQSYGNGYSPRLMSRESYGNASSRGLNNTEEMTAEMKMIRLKIQQLTKETYGMPGILMDAVDMKMKSVEFASQEAAADQAERIRLSRGSNSEQMGRSNREMLQAAADHSYCMPKSETMATRINSRSAGSSKISIYDGVSAGVRYRRYSMEEIEKATNNFSEVLKIGEGGYGPVFKSTLDHTLVAIKILHSDVAQGMRQFQQEVEVLSSIRHPNMVLLMGACPDIGALVYEFMSNGSLEDRLFRRGNTPPLPWRLRFRIAAEIATGLLFLHQNKPEPLVHRDLKPGNILLDNNFVSKIADVGLARLIPPSLADSVTQYRMTAAAGTFCYIDPEYQMTGMLGIKSDIYALGIILLQLISGKPPMGLAKNMEDAIEMDRFENMLDPSVPDWPVQEALLFAKLSLRCAELRRKDRPELAAVVLPELNRLRTLADESPSSTSISGHFQHANTTWNRQTVSAGHSAGDIIAGYAAANNSSDQGRPFSASAVRAPRYHER